MTTSFTIDRIEGNIAIVECGDETFELPKAILPDGSNEGDTFLLQRLSPIPDDTNTARLERLKSQDSGDDIIDL